MTTQTLGILLSIGLLLLGLLQIFGKDWVWDRHEANMRARGVVNLERTPEWETRQNALGGVLIVIALVVVVLIIL